MTRSYTLDNWDGHLPKFESHKLPQALRGQAPLEDPALPASATGDLQRPVLFSPNFKASIVEGSLAYGRSKSHYLADDASNQRPHNTIPHPFKKTRLFDSPDFSDTDLVSDIVTDALNPPSSAARHNEPRSPTISRNGTRCSPFSTLSPEPETLVPSPALTVQTISTYTADAHGEEEDDDVIILDHIQTAFSPQDKLLDKAATNTLHDSLFTPPASEAGESPSTSESPPPLNHGKKSWTRIVASPIPRRMRIMASHVSVPLLSKPKEEYISLSSLVNPARKRPHRIAQDRLKDVLNAVWENNESLSWLGEDDGGDDDDGDGRRKKRKRKYKPEEGSTRPVARRSHDDDDSVVFVNRTSIVEHLVEEQPRPAETTFIDLTLDNDDEVNPPNILSTPTQSVAQVTEVTSLNQQSAAGETQIRIGLVHSISYKTLLHNTRFLRRTTGDSDLHKDFITLDSLPFRRRALLDNNLGGSSFLVDEFSLGFPVLSQFGLKAFDEDYDNSVDDVIELFDSSSESAAPKLVLSPETLRPPPTLMDEPLPCPPKIDLAAKYRKKKSAASRRSSALTPVRKTAPARPSSTSAVSHSPMSSLRNRPVQDVVMDHDGYNPHTPLVPSAKALGKRRAVESPLQAMQLRPDVQSLFPSSRTVESVAASTTVTADNSFDSYINYWPASPGRPMTLISDNPSLHLGTGDAYSYPDPYSNVSLSNFKFVEPRHHQYPSPIVEPPPPPPPPAASFLYHSDDYNGVSGDFDGFAASVLGDPPPPSESTLLPSWSPQLDTGFQYDNATINPSLLGGGPLGISEQHPESYFPDVENEFVDPDDRPLSITQSHSRSASPMMLSSPPKSESFHPVHVRRDTDSGTIFVRRRPTTSDKGGDLPIGGKRRHVQRSMPDMVPSAYLASSYSSSSEMGDGSRRSTKPRGRGGVRSTPSNHIQSKTKSRPTVARKAAAILPTGLNMSGPKVMIGGQPWPMQDEPAYCHQCRNKTMALKFDCAECSKAFCIRCLTLRYPDEPRALQMKEAGCPSCLDYCNCTNCCKKRGVQYISTKNALAGGIASRARLKAKSKPKLLSSGVSSLSPVPELGVASPSRPSSPPLYSRAPVTPTGGVYWGMIYGADGAKIGKGFSFAKEDVVERRAPVVPTNGVYWGVVYGADGSKIGKGYTVPKEEVGRITGSAVLTKPASDAAATTVQPKRTKRRRVYVGKIHPSWQFDGAVKKSVLDPVPPPKRVHESRRPRKYVGNKAFLFYKSEKMARELADLSPLSSLEENWDEEDRMKVDEDWDVIRIVGKAGSDDGREASHDASKNLSDQDVMRAIGLGLHACGIQLAG